MGAAITKECVTEGTSSLGNLNVTLSDADLRRLVKGSVPAKRRSTRSVGTDEPRVAICDLGI